MSGADTKLTFDGFAAMAAADPEESSAAMIALPQSCRSEPSRNSSAEEPIDRSTAVAVGVRRASNAPTLLDASLSLLQVHGLTINGRIKVQGCDWQRWARETLIDEMAERQRGTLSMPAWQQEPVVNDYAIDLFAYLSTRSEGWLGMRRPPLL